MNNYRNRYAPMRDPMSAPAPTQFNSSIYSLVQNIPAVTQEAATESDPERGNGMTHGNPTQTMSARLALTLIVLGILAPRLDADATVVSTDRGTIRGVVNGAVVQFLGVPYAASPTGSLRFKPPQPHVVWSGVLDATKAGNRCPSNQRNMQTPMAEDCLNLGVTVPYAVAVPKMPVYVWFHGGGFQNGDAALVDPAASAMATRNNVIVVTVNYRLGLLGYLGLPILDTGDGKTGNYGLEDQQSALRWVKSNIAKFGGDPTNVTIGGESAGASSVCQLFASPDSKGLFVRGIIESGSCGSPLLTMAEKYKTHATVPEQLGCPGTNEQVLACLRSENFSVEKALKVSQALQGFRPTVGGGDLPKQPVESLGLYPSLIGFNFSEPVQIICSTLKAFELNTSSQKAPMYGYEFHDPASPNVHTSELRYLWLNFVSDSYLPNSPSLTGGSAFLSDAMIKYWGNFIRKGDPNSSGLPTWSPRLHDSDVMQLVPEALGKPADVNAGHSCGAEQISRANVR